MDSTGGALFIIIKSVAKQKLCTPIMAVLLAVYSAVVTYTEGSYSSKIVTMHNVMTLS
jgi:hypothetical protein